MPNEEGNSNSQQNKIPASEGMNAGLPGYRSDQALSLTARTPIHAGMPSLISYIGQKSRYLGESGIQLARRVIGSDYLASIVLRATRLPILSSAIDYISRKTTFITPMLQQVLQLPWFQQHQKPGHGINRTAGAAGRIGLRSNELYPSMLLRTLSGTEEKPFDEVDETYQPTAEETYPVIAGGLPLPPAASGEIPDAAPELPRYPIVTSRRFDVKQGIDRKPESSREFTGPRGEPTRHTRVTSMPLDARQIINRMVTERSRGFIGSRVEPPKIPLSGIYRSREIEETDREQLEGALSLDKVDGQPESPQQHRKWSQVLMTLARRVFGQHRPVAARPQIAGEDISEVHDAETGRSYHDRAVEPEVGGGAVVEQPALPFSSDTTVTGESQEAAVPDVHVLRKPASSEQPEILQSRSPSSTPTARSKPSIFRSILDLPVSIPGPSIIRRAARYINQLVSNQPPSRTLAAGEGTKEAPGRVSQERVPQAGQSRYEPVVSLSSEPATTKDSVSYRDEDIRTVEQGPDAAGTALTKDDVVYQSKGETDIGQASDTLYPLTLEYGGIEQRYIQRRMNKPWLRGESSFVTIPPVQLLPVPGMIHRTIASPSQRLFKSRARTPRFEGIEDYGFQREQEYMPSASGYDYTREPALEMPVPSLIQPKAEYDAAYSQEFFTGTSGRHSILPELTYTRSQSLPGLEKTQVSRALQEPSRPAAVEPEEETAGEAAAPDINVIARDVYRILRRRLINERERALGVV